MEVNCSVSGCEFLTHRKNPAYCNKHYWRYTEHGSPELPPRKNKRYHPNYIRWHERKADCVAAWIDFWKFAADIGDCPGEHFTLEKLRQKEPWGPHNFKWRQNLFRLPDENDAEFHARKWASRMKQFPEFDRARQISKRFNMTVEEYETRFRRQKGVCAICKNPETFAHKSGTINRLAIDHCHTSGKIRDLLCRRCNQALGIVNESTALLQSMLRYIRKHE